MTSILWAADLKVDHVTVAGTDISAMSAKLGSMGIALEFGGEHSNRATLMSFASFPDGSYIELIALQAIPDEKAVAAHYWSKQILGNAGPAAWAIRANEIAADTSRLQSAGVTVSAASRSGRTRPEGTQLEWETAQIGTEPNGTFFPFLIHDFTPRENRMFTRGRPTSEYFAGVTRVVIAVRDLKSSIARFRQAFGLAAAVEQADSAFGARLAGFAGTPVVLAAPLNAQGWLAQRIERFGEGPCAFVLGSKRGYKSLQPKPGTPWFGRPISWFDSEKLGWHLGVED